MAEAHLPGIVAGGKARGAPGAPSYRQAGFGSSRARWQEEAAGNEAPQDGGVGKDRQGEKSVVRHGFLFGSRLTHFSSGRVRTFLRTYVVYLHYTAFDNPGIVQDCCGFPTQDMGRAGTLPADTRTKCSEAQKRLTQTRPHSLRHHIHRSLVVVSGSSLGRLWVHHSSHAQK